MNLVHKEIVIKTISGRHSYHNITEKIESFLKENMANNGVLAISTPHTTCSFFFDEIMHDRNYFGDDYLHVDINNTLEKIIPKMTSENQYNSPGPKHIEFGLSLNDKQYPSEKWVMLNTDAHIKASIYGSNSCSFIIKEKEILIGKLGQIFFVDWDQLRDRKRTINLLFMGE